MMISTILDGEAQPSMQSFLQYSPYRHQWLAFAIALSALVRQIHLLSVKEADMWV